MYKRIIASILSLLMLTSTAVYFSGCNETPVDSTDYKTSEKVENGAILQAFCWDFNTIKKSMADIAAAGFSAVQTSPINECLVGEDGGMELYGNGKWYYHYQPTDFKIGNYQLGTRDEFKAMCDEAEKYGVKVIVDIIANHTTPQTDKVSKDLIEAGGGSLETLYHKGNAHDLIDYSNRLDCTTYKMGGLPDINTERTSFQDYFIDFVNDCIACGADGFRYDTAKHIGLPDDPKEDDGFKNNFWERVTKEIDKADDMFIYGEVLQGNNDRIADYINEIGRTTSSTYGSKIRAAIENNIVDTSAVKEYWLGDAPLNMVTWVESHD
ncbi:MAG: alpha-amylase family glycosyl hydrolase, partial [Clostridia bacterium]|nr:alpha-amylase family glycosyl hydrolase [Clostridia bacterium]